MLCSQDMGRLTDCEGTTRRRVFDWLVQNNSFSGGAAWMRLQSVLKHEMPDACTFVSVES